MARALQSGPADELMRDLMDARCVTALGALGWDSLARWKEEVEGVESEGTSEAL